ncbi:membrane-spanning 4-domains subfamily A member 4A-like isoform X13 [Ailuropoda melanoleuca]|uniref:membrane-spanning 4-domains subfamily A member 4A-like isoform X13 n=1 Tax=Ailuropoda melanoleuca TaxID=9646 RepID=UPI000947C8FA|nr:membrane-spanning 4-domains subfamily A member 4A-like isoform X13 [Ailuropoda melanoleuca]
MVLRNDGQEELSPPIWCSSRGMQSTKACVNTPEGATAWFGPNPPQKHIIQGDQTDTLKTFLKGEPQILGFFVSGAVSIAAGRKMTLNLIKGSLGMNMLSAVVGGIGVIILTVELTVDHGPEKRCLILRVFETVILVLSLLEVSITISLSVFGCKTTCFVTQVVVIQPTNDQVPPGMAPYEHVYEDLEF